jgi:hypothetical protein
MPMADRWGPRGCLVHLVTQGSVGPAFGGSPADAECPFGTAQKSAAGSAVHRME